jgi:hypothetical protein
LPNLVQFCEDPKQALESASGVFIKQQFEIMEILTGYETPNKYQIYYKQQNTGQTRCLFICKEMSGCCERQYCKGESRPFQMNVNHCQGGVDFGVDFAHSPFAVFNKPYKIQCYCCCRPYMEGYWGGMNGKPIGQVCQPWTCCDPKFQILDDVGKVKYSMTTNCCTCGFLCGNSCGCFEPVIFPIFEGEEADSSKADQAVGKISKQGMGIQSMIGDNDNFEVMFPTNATLDDKMMIIVSALMIDYSLFEEKQGMQNHH